MAIIQNDPNAIGILDKTDDDNDRVWFDRSPAYDSVYVYTSNDGAYIVRDDALEVVKWLISRFQFEQSSLYPVTPVPTDNAQTQEPSPSQNSCTCDTARKDFLENASNPSVPVDRFWQGFLAANRVCKARHGENAPTQTLKENP